MSGFCPSVVTHAVRRRLRMLRVFSSDSSGDAGGALGPPVVRRLLGGTSSADDVSVAVRASLACLALP